MFSARCEGCGSRSSYGQLLCQSCESLLFKPRPQRKEFTIEYYPPGSLDPRRQPQPRPKKGAKRV
jgi:hypothetical protein